MLGPLRRLARFTVAAAAGGAAGMFVGLGAAGFARHRRDRTGLGAGLHRALSHNGFEVRYQPIVRLPGRQCIGAEALLRLRNHAGTLIGPGTFIPLAEHTGLIQAMTERVIELVGKDFSSVLAARPDLHVSINLPPSVLAAGWLQQVARRSRLYPLRTQVIIEITETGTVGARGREIVALARSLGVRVAIDDFGTGANDLAQLQDLQVDFIKIDHSFVAKIGSEAPGARLIEAIVTIAHDVSAGTIAEGVETEVQAAYLHEIGVDFGQGFLFAPPLTLREFRRYLDRSPVFASQPEISRELSREEKSPG